MKNGISISITNVSLFVILLLLASCGGGDKELISKRAGINEVIVWESANPDKLNPLVSNSANSGYIERYIYQALLDIHAETFEYVPILAESRPTVEPLTEGEYDGGLKITYTIRPEARWSNGTPVTANDVLFSLKLIKNPTVDCQNVRPYLEYIEDAVMYPEEPLKISFMCKGRYFMSEIWSALTIYPEYLFDSTQVLRKYDVKWMNNAENIEKMKGDAELILFGKSFNSEAYGREPKFVDGSGPYYLEEFKTNQRVIIKKKSNWWGEKFIGQLRGFENYPDKMTFEIITEPTTALTALKDEQLDVMRGIKAKEFAIELPQNESFNSLYKTYSPMALQYSYIGLNMRSQKLSDKRVRQALTHLIDIDYIIDILYYDLAVPIVGPIHPSKPYYNKNLTPRKYDPTKAQALLEEAGWKDTDGDGIRDKSIDGKKTDLKLSIKFPQGSETGEQILLMFQENAAKAGVAFELIQKEWTVFLEDNKRHDFDLYLGGWVAAPTLADMKQIWHTESYDRGGNYVGFGNQETDDLIEAIRYESDETKRNEMYFKIQEIIYEEAPYIFLFSTNSRIAIHKRFEAKAHVKRPGYYEGEFVLLPNFGVKAVAEN